MAAFVFAFFSFFLFFTGVLAPARANPAPPLPLWELGLGVLGFRMPHYRGADQGRTYVWPLPYFNYRGKVIQAQNSFINGNFIETEDFTLGLSMNAALRVTSARNQAREGMPSLDPAFEIGPMASYDFWKDGKKKNFLSLNVPLRGVMAAEFFRVEPVGFFSVPFLAFTALPQEMTWDCYTEVTLAAMYGSQHYHDYYYGVAPEYATAGRNAYGGRRGYSGSHFTWFLSRKVRQFYGFVFFRYDNLKGAAFEDSPLFKTQHYVSFGGGLIWYFLQSKEFSTRIKQD